MLDKVVMMGLVLLAIYTAYLLVDQAINFNLILSDTIQLPKNKNLSEQTLKSDEQFFKKISQIKFQDYQGSQVSLADFKGKPIILNSWASWCHFCLEELSALAQVQAEFGDKIVIVAINRKEPLEVAKNFSDRAGVTPQNLHLWLDSKDSFYKSIGGFSMPETLFIDKQGNLVEHKRGPIDFQTIREKARNFFY